MRTVFTFWTEVTWAVVVVVAAVAGERYGAGGSGDGLFAGRDNLFQCCVYLWCERRKGDDAREAGDVWTNISNYSKRGGIGGGT